MESKTSIGNAHIPSVSRKQIFIRLLYTILFLFILGIVELIVQIVVLFQFIYFFITQKPNVPVRQFSNKISTYAYRIFRYITLNESKRPFPFPDFPLEMEPPEEPITFDSRKISKTKIYSLFISNINQNGDVDTYHVDENGFIVTWKNYSNETCIASFQVVGTKACFVPNDRNWVEMSCRST